MKFDPYAIIKRPIVTEKSTTDTEYRNTYTFFVDARANKIEIREAVEKLFKVKVEKVRTQNRKGKPRRVRSRWIRKPDWKKAMVKLAEGNKIEIL